MGPSGNGKSTLGSMVAKQLGWRFIEGDDHHPPANIAKMARGEPLDDADRAPFLEAVADALSKGPAVAACSALRRRYRDLICQRAGCSVLFILPQIDKDELLRRLQNRTAHFMPPILLESQLAALELPEEDELHLLLDGHLPSSELVPQITEYVRQST